MVIRLSVDQREESSKHGRFLAWAKGFSGALLKVLLSFLTSGTVLVVIACLGIIAASTCVSIAYWDELGTKQESLSATIRNIAVVVGGALALLLSIWRSVIADRQANAARRQSETAQQGLWNERFQKGAENLWNSDLSVRLGGVYALDRLAKEQPDAYHIQVMELLCAFIRNASRKSSDTSVRFDTRPRHGKEVSVDVQEVMNAIGRRNADGIELEKATPTFQMDLSNLDLQSISLTNGDFRGANFRNTHLMHAYCGNTSFRGANLASAKLYMATLIFSDMTDADLSWADLSGADLGAASLQNADVSNSDFGVGEELVPTDEVRWVARPAKLTQRQLDEAKCKSDTPPKIAPGTTDSETKEALIWRGEVNTGMQ